MKYPDIDNDSVYLTDKVEVKTLILQKDDKESLENREFNITILAEQIGWNRVTVSSVINNKPENISKCKFKSIQMAIAKALGVDIGNILLTMEA